MPEGPELHVAARFVNNECGNVLFSGKVVKSAVSTKNPDVPWDKKLYKVSATSRGKEVRLILTEAGDNGSKKPKSSVKKGDTKNGNTESMDILVRFGMSGKFMYVPVEEQEKHAHLNFYTADGKNVLSFVDYRRFGRWEVTSEWGPKRGPCIILEYEKFRENVLANLNKATFNKAVCETMLDQEFFNGVGNYLRSEVLYRLSIPPFTCARTVLEPLADLAKCDVKIKQEAPDLLYLCHKLATEVTELNKGRGPMYQSKDEGEFQTFVEWLQCYYQEGMSNMVDHNGRTIWFNGPAGPMVPKDKKSRGKIKRGKLVETSDNTEEPATKKAKMTRGELKTKAHVNKNLKGKSKKNTTKSTKARKVSTAAAKKTPKKPPGKATKKEQLPENGADQRNGYSPRKTRSQRKR